MKKPHAADADLGSSGDFRPTAGWRALRLRAAMLRTVREFFHDRGFLEVETPVLSADTVVDRHLDPFVLDDGGRRFYLQTSPEFCMKRLLASGAGAIYQITRAFRREEHGRLHNPEFTMVEWYRPGDGLAEGMQLLSDLAEAMLGRGPAELVSYQEAFRRHVGIDPHTADADALIQAVRASGIDTPASLSSADRDGWLDLLLVERVQPHLGVERPTIVYDYPASQSALAQVRPGPPPVAERFELYVSGIELANGYHELTDADELRRRIAQANELRRQDGKSALPEENRLLAAMDAGLPESTGVAMGFDRLVMVAAGATSLAEVMAFPIDRA